MTAKVLPGEDSAGCKAWKAPQLEHEKAGRRVADRFASAAGSPREQQELLGRQVYDKRFAEGYRDGLARGEKEIREQGAYLESLMATLAAPLIELDKQVVDELVQLCMAVVRQLVRRELKQSPDEIVAVVKEALSQLPVSAGDARLELHPEDAMLVRRALGGIESETRWQIVEDPVLSRGGCRVSTSTSRIDATVESRVNAAIAAVMGGERHVD